MALHEGLCTNCGSLMRLNDENESTYCIFCWAEVNTAEGIRLGVDASGHKYENVEYAEPATEVKVAALQAQGLGGASVMAAVPARRTAAVEKRAEGKLTPRERVALQNKPIVKPYCATKHRVAIIGGVVAFLLVLSAVALPIYLTRENKKTALKEKLPTFLAYANEENRLNIERQRNQVIIIVSPAATSENEALSIFQNYAQAYAEVYEITEEAAQAKVEVRLFDSESGGYNIRMIDGEVKATDLN